MDKRFLLASQILPLALFLLWILNALPRILVMITVVVQVGLSIIYLCRQIVKYRKQEELNWQKLMLFALVIPLHWLAFAFAVSADQIMGLLIFSIAVNIGHSLQYHRLMWLHNQNRYKGNSGLTGFVGRSAICYYAASLGLYLFFVFVGMLLPTGSELLLTGPIFMHYVLDARIWRMREDPDLARALNLS